MKKNIAKFFLLCNTIILFFSIGITSYAERGTCGSNISWEIENNVLTITGSGKMEEAPHFSQYDFTSVVFDDRITEIPAGIFMDCDELSEVKLPKNLLYIPYEAFSNCWSLKNIVIPDKVAMIASFAFDEVPLKKVTIPLNVLSIGKCAFDGPVDWYVDGDLYEGISEVNYGGTYEQWNKIKIISGTNDSDPFSTGNQSFDSATIHFNNNIVYSGKCGDNATWRIYDNTLHISGTGKIYDYFIIESGNSYPIWFAYDYDVIKIDEGITEIGMCAFDEMILSVGHAYDWKCFGYLSDDEIEINGLSVTDDNRLYYSIDKVKEIYLPNSLKLIGDSVLNCCNKLTDVYYAGTEEEWESIDIQSNNDSLMNAKKHYNTSEEGYDFENITLTDKVFVYDGSEKELTISGTLPAGASVRYINNKATDVGTHTVTAIISASGYKTLILKADMTIIYKVNNVALPIPGYEEGKEWDNCWTFARNIYKEIWGTNEGDDLLRDLSLADRKINEINTKSFIMSSKPGANIRLEDGEDTYLHSLILVQKDDVGFTVYHGNYDGAIYFTRYTYSEFAEHYANYRYFEYIKFPDAPAYYKSANDGDKVIALNETIADNLFTCDLYFNSDYNKQSAFVAVAFYDINNKLVEVVSKPVDVKFGKTDFSIEFEREEYSTYKLLVWDGYDTLRPLKAIK